ncbi:MAG TPA: hypothetical protein VNS22_21925 [Geminicoccus sp.]|uniref:hypothetical protein n=1 Tax=Geminicoccus sp. TaxID=2024832 RepID=UPI002D002718|nr:hypothetical protein [Geminicoccus sp.]HWL71015.1 hypothetical protein [Geminicoccus sp.]
MSDLKPGTAAKLATTKHAHAGFAVDAWLANWGMIGLSNDNLQIGPDGKAVRVDVGGSLEYRPQGAKKVFGHEVAELASLRDPKVNAQAAAVFGGSRTRTSPPQSHASPRSATRTSGT